MKHLNSPEGVYMNPVAGDNQMSAQQQALAVFDPNSPGAAYMANCIMPNMPPINAANLSVSAQGGPQNIQIQWDYVGASGEGATDEVIRWGGPGAFAGSSAFFGLPPSAADSSATDNMPGVITGPLAGVGFTQGFSAQVATEPVVITKFHMISDDPIQINQVPVYNYIWLDNQRRPTLLNIPTSFGRGDFNDNNAIIHGTWPVFSKGWLEVNLRVDTTLTVILTVSAISDIYAFRQTGCYPDTGNVNVGNNNNTPFY